MNTTLRNSKIMDAYKCLNLSETCIDTLSDEATDWANTHGIVMRNRKNLDLINFAPFTLFPSPFPEYLYKEAFDVHKSFQTLMHKCSSDHDFLELSLKSVIVNDEFTRKLFDIYATIKKEGTKQPISIDLMRNDFMLDKKVVQENGYHEANTAHRDFELRQIEVNMIASSFSGLGSSVCQLHRYISDVLLGNSPFKKEMLPENNPIVGLSRGLAEAWKLYGSEDAVLLFVVQAGEKNRFDQRLMQYNFQERIKEHYPNRFVPAIFKSLSDIHKHGKLTTDHRLLIDDTEVAVAYFRAGYAPSDYVTEDCWKARLMIERSKAIKSPNIASHLVGCKKIQQVLSNQSTVERFIKDSKEVAKICRTFAGLYSLDEGKEGDSAAKMALANPDRYVLKPQREGGGNNYYGDELVSVLKSIKDPLERSQYILMDKVNAPVYKNYIVHIDFERPKLLDVVNEIGIFGILLSNGDQEIINETVGYLVRTKSIEHADGGVAAGRAVLDSVCLF